MPQVSPPFVAEPMMDDPSNAEHFGTAGIPGRKLTHSEIKGIIQREIEDSLGGLGSQVSEQQRTAIRYYWGRPMGNEIKDRSQVVSKDVFEVIEWTMPSLMRMFTGGTHIVRFKAKNKEGQKDAEHATAYINDLFQNKLEGFDILYDFFKSGLLEKNGFLKVYYEVKRYPEVQSFTGLTEDELMQVMEGEDEEEVEPLASEERDAVIEGVQMKLYDVTVRIWRVKKGIKIDGIPSEEFMIARRTIKLGDESPFTAQRKKVTVSDLVAMGYPFKVVSILPSDDTPEFSQGRTERLSEDETYPVTTAERTDAASRQIWITDCYVRLDEDGDGYSELRKILIVGEHVSTILDDEEISMNPFVSATPFPMPYKFYGQGLADLVMDLQQIRSTILRQILDHIYLSVNPRLAVVEGQVEFDDLLTVRPGGLVRQRQPGQIEPLQLPPLPREAFEIYQALEETRANRTGIMAHGRELDASAINSTATGLAQLMAEKQQKIELIARIYAQALKKMFKKILRLVVENDLKAQQVKMNGQWIEINPSRWDQDMDLDIEVGLGAGQAIERIANLEKIMGLQAQHVQNGGMNYTVTPENLHNSAVSLTEACGFRNEELFFTNPEGQEPPDQGPSPEELKLKLEAMKASSEQEQKMADFELATKREKSISAFRYAELEMKERVETMRIEMEERVRLGQQEATIEAASISADARDEGDEDDGNE